jgi:hypothetical protein
LMTMFNLPCQIAWLPRHHFPVLRGCSHSRGLLLAHSRGWAIHWVLGNIYLLHWDLQAGIP